MSKERVQEYLADIAERDISAGSVDLWPVLKDHLHQETEDATMPSSSPELTANRARSRVPFASPSVGSWLRGIGSLGFAATMILIFVVSVFIWPNRNRSRGETGFASAPPDQAGESPVSEPAPGYLIAQPLQYPYSETDAMTLDQVGRYQDATSYELTFTDATGSELLFLVQQPANSPGVQPSDEPGDTVDIMGTTGKLVEKGVNNQSGVEMYWQAYGTGFYLITTLDREDALRFAGEVGLTFTPWGFGVRPDDLPSGKEMFGGAVDGQMVYAALTYGTDRFVYLEQHPAWGRNLPEGETVAVNGATAILTSLDGGMQPIQTADLLAELGVESDNVPPNDTGDQPDEIRYAKAYRLTWIEGDAWLQMTGNVKLEELLATAAGLQARDVPAIPELQPTELATEQEPPLSDGSSATPAPALSAGNPVERLGAVAPVFAFSIAADWLPEGFNSARAVTAIDPVHGDVVTEARWWSDGAFVMVTDAPLFYAALSSGEPMDLRGTTSILHAIELPLIDLARDVPQTGEGWQSIDSSSDGPEVAPAEPVGGAPGYALVWAEDGVLFTALSNLPPEELTAFVAALRLSTAYIISQPYANGGGQWQRVDVGFAPFAPAYLPDGMRLDSIETSLQQLVMEYVTSQDERFVHITQTPAPENAADSYMVPHYNQGPDTMAVEMVRDGVWVWLETNLPEEEAIHIAESLVGP